MAENRLDKILVDTGLCSRSEAKHLIRAGRVTVDGVPAAAPEQRADPDQQCVALDGTPLEPGPPYYYMLHKPRGVITATEDSRQRTVMDLLPPRLRAQGLFPVGRLDKDTSGLLLLTDDGAWAHRIISPRHLVAKRYLAGVDGIPTDADADAVRAGLLLGDGTQCLPGDLTPTDDPHSVIVTIREGKYHQVRRMLAALGKPVLTLHRLSIGALALDEALQPGDCRRLTPREAEAVFREWGTLS